MVHLLLRGQPLGTGPGQAASIDAVLFDKDGTLSHSEPMLEALAKARIERCLALATAHDGGTGFGDLGVLLARAYGINAQGIEPGGITAVAARDHNLIATATALTQAGFSWPDAQGIAEACFAQTDALHGQGADHPPLPTPGLGALLARLSAASVRCAVISNDHEQGIHSFLTRHSLDHHVDAVWSAEHHPRKPDPAAVHGLCRELRVEPGRCALIGDAASDLRMALAAGVPVALGYSAGWRQAPCLDPGTPCVHHWDELDVAVHTEG
ncbi:MAG: HAD family hydrolase [Cyanobium sp.]